MENFLHDHKDYFDKQTGLFKFTVAPEKEDESVSDTVIATRVRPLLPHEKELREVVGVSTDNRCVAVHELRRKVNGQPALNVSTISYAFCINGLRMLVDKLSSRQGLWSRSELSGDIQ